jgi:hypothetical protein
LDFFAVSETSAEERLAASADSSCDRFAASPANARALVQRSIPAGGREEKSGRFWGLLTAAGDTSPLTSVRDGRGSVLALFSRGVLIASKWKDRQVFLQEPPLFAGIISRKK